jgi:hypothetical protein
MLFPIYKYEYVHKLYISSYIKKGYVHTPFLKIKYVYLLLDGIGSPLHVIEPFNVFHLYFSKTLYYYSSIKFMNSALA